MLDTLGAIQYIKNNICNATDKLYIGIISDTDTKSYKRKLIINENNRFEMMESIC